MIHVMMDLETRGTVPGCVAFSIGCVVFNPITGTLGREFYAVIDIEDCKDHYLAEDQPTIDWWDKQSPEARVALEEALSGRASKLKNALGSLNAWFVDLGKKSDIRLYGNGADFDNPILRVMYQVADIEPAYGEWGGRCYRTLKNLDELLGPEFKFAKLERQGTYHNALDDAKSQAKHLMDNIAAIRSSVTFRDKE